ncbi:MAG: hypothetical protein QM784_29710 [Polyangiaceae bacterium]
MKACRWVVGAFLVASLSWQSASDATIVRAVGLAKLVQVSDWVVVGTVTSVQSHYVTVGQTKRMVTDATLQIDHVVLAPSERSLGTATETTSSEAGSVVTVRTMGGTVDGIAQAVLGEAVLRPGSTNLLFLRRGYDNAFHVSGMAQGEYVLQADAQGQLRLKPSPGLDVVVNPEQSAIKTLTGRTLDQVELLVGETANQVRKIP